MVRSPATRATALLTAEAIPASVSSASASTAAVSGATVIVRPSENTRTAGRDLREVGRVQPGSQEEEDAGRGDEWPGAHEQARPVPVCEGAEAAREGEHDQCRRERCKAGLERAVAGDLLQEDHEVEEQDREPGVHREGLEVADREVAAFEQAQREHGLRSLPLVGEEPGEREDASDERQDDRGARPAEAAAAR